MVAQGVAADGPQTGRRALAVDLGERRIGIAVSDDDGSFALPLAVLERVNDREAIGAIRQLAAERDIALLVVGEPLDTNGVRGEAARRARRFGERLGRATVLPCLFVDETLTTVEAAALLRTRGPGRRNDGPRQEARGLDAVAAQVILQEAIDRGLTRGVSS